MEYGWTFIISGLEMMVKSGLEEIFSKVLHALAILPNKKEEFSSKVQIQ